MPDTQLEAKRISSAFNLLRFGNRHWKGAEFGQIAFRGQGDSKWELTPSAFRLGEKIGWGDDAIETPALGSSREQAIAEYYAVRRFVELADQIGLPLPGDLMRFRAATDKSGREEELFWTEKWIPDEFLELAAIAQHHGVRTRLLDFTFDPLAAVYFAASKALELRKSENPPSHFTVWALDLRFTRTVWSRKPGFPERIKEIVVPRAGNPYLRAQRGLFLVDVGATRTDESGSKWNAKPLNEIIAERSTYWIEQSGGWPGIDLEKGFFLPFIRIDIRVGLAPGVLARLQSQGINEATIYPSHDRVVSALGSLDAQGLLTTQAPNAL